METLFNVDLQSRSECDVGGGSIEFFLADWAVALDLLAALPSSSS